MADGQVLEEETGGPWTAREQIAWEEHHRQSFVNVYRAMQADRAAADADPEAAASSYRLGWVLWFGWYRLRPRVANRFAAFIDDLDDWDFVVPAADEPAGEPETEGPGEDGSLDPTTPPAEPSPADPSPTP
jgi:hypothetical protein